MATMICPHCETEFVKKTMWHRFCSSGCADAHRHGWKAKSLPNCAHCGDPVQPRDEKLGRKRKYCSDLCRSDSAKGNPPRSPAIRKEAQRAYLHDVPFSLKAFESKPNAMPEPDADEPIGWDDILSDIRAGREKRDDRKRYGYQKGDWGVSNSPS